MVAAAALERARDAAMGKTEKRVVKQPEVRRSEIIEAAAGAFREKGYVATSVAEIVRKVGISHGSFFYYFPTKQDVLVALGKSRLESFRETLRAWIADEGITPARKVANAVGRVDSLRNLRMAVDYVGFGFIRQDPEVHNTLVNLAVPMLVDDLERLLRQGIERGEFRISSPRGTAVCMILLAADLIHRADVTGTVVKWPDLYDAFRGAVAGMLGLKELPPTP